MADKELAPGFYAKYPKDSAPDFVKMRLSVRMEKFLPWIQTQAGKEWVNLEVLESKSGKPYVLIDDWEPSGGAQTGQTGWGGPPANPAPAAEPTEMDDDIPF